MPARDGDRNMPDSSLISTRRVLALDSALSMRNAHTSGRFRPNSASWKRLIVPSAAATGMWRSRAVIPPEGR
jgi:hypothetical protein